jgi:hypothetical protein
MAAISGSTLLMAGLAAAGTAAAASALKKPKAPDLPDPRVERAKAEAEAASKTNSALAMRNRARAASSLLAKPGADSTTSEVGALGASPGKTKLGQ